LQCANADITARSKPKSIVQSAQTLDPDAEVVPCCATGQHPLVPNDSMIGAANANCAHAGVDAQAAKDNVQQVEDRSSCGKITVPEAKTPPRRKRACLPDLPTPEKRSRGSSCSLPAQVALEGVVSAPGFEANMEAGKYLFGEAAATVSQTTFGISSRRSAVEPWKRRIVACTVKGAKRNLSVTFHGESSREVTDIVPFWPLPYMRGFVRQVRARLPSRRRSQPPLNIEDVSNRCPALWWSLVAFALGWRVIDGEARVPSLEFPVALPVSMSLLMDTLVTASDNEVSDAEALRIMETVLAE